jgi:hypothetical protein
MSSRPTASTDGSSGTFPSQMHPPGSARPVHRDQFRVRDRYGVAASFALLAQMRAAQRGAAHPIWSPGARRLRPDPFRCRRGAASRRTFTSIGFRQSHRHAPRGRQHRCSASLGTRATSGAVELVVDRAHGRLDDPQYVLVPVGSEAADTQCCVVLLPATLVGELGATSAVSAIAEGRRNRPRIDHSRPWWTCSSEHRGGTNTENQFSDVSVIPEHAQEVSFRVIERVCTQLGQRSYTDQCADSVTGQHLADGFRQVGTRRGLRLRWPSVIGHASREKGEGGQRDDG